MKENRERNQRQEGQEVRIVGGREFRVTKLPKAGREAMVRQEVAHTKAQIADFNKDYKESFGDDPSVPVRSAEVKARAAAIRAELNANLPYSPPDYAAVDDDLEGRCLVPKERE